MSSFALLVTQCAHLWSLTLFSARWDDQARGITVLRPKHLMARTLVFNGYGFQRKQNFLSEIWVFHKHFKNRDAPTPLLLPYPHPVGQLQSPSLVFFPPSSSPQHLEDGENRKKKMQRNDPLFIYSPPFFFCSCLSPVERHPTNPADLNKRQSQFMAGGLIRDQHKCTIDTIVACWQSPFQRVLFTPKPWPFFLSFVFEAFMVWTK